MNVRLRSGYGDDRRALLMVIYGLTFAAAAACSFGREDHSAAEEHMSFSSGSLGVSDVYIAEPITRDRTSMYFTVSNRAKRTDELVDVKTTIAGRAELHSSWEQDGRVMMERVPGVRIPSGWQVHFAPGSYHVMLADLTRTLQAGEMIAAELTFKSGGIVRVNAQVIPYAEVAEMLSAGSELGVAAPR